MGASVADPLYAARVKVEVERRLFGGSGVLRVGRFEVGERIGAGGMSVVYDARDPELDRRVALKLLQEGVHGERLMREARALAKLRHPNVVAVYEVGRWGEHVFLALEHVEGDTFAAWRAARPRTTEEILRVALAIAEGLAAVHDLGLVHRDVKPDNVIVDASGAPRLVDFGLVADAERDDALPDAASHAPAGTELTRPGATPGTPRYIAPERRAGAPASAASDQYSFGVMLEEALEGAASADAARAIAARARADDPKARFPDMRAAGRALHAVASPPRRAVPLALALAVALVLVLVLALSSAPSPAPASSTDLAPLDPAAANDPPGYAELSVGTRDVEARRQVRLGLLALRDGARNEAAEAFEHAMALDPHYGAAFFWRAVLAHSGDVNGARVAFEHAVAERDGMSTPLRAMVEALVPCIQWDPIDDVACEERLSAAAARMPRSAHLWYLLGGHRLARTGPTSEVAGFFEHALEADPEFVLAIYLQAQVLAYVGRFDEALAMTEACVRAVPGSDACVHDRAWIHIALGECDALAADARGLRAAMPNNGLSYGYLAAVAMAHGEPSSVVGEHLRQARERAPENVRPLFGARDEVTLAMLDGDFERALAAVPAMEAAMQSETDRATRLLGRRARILIALETGDRAEAARLAEESLALSQAWVPDPRNEDFGIARDAEPFLVDVLRDTGAIDEAERSRRRDAWLAAWRARTAPFNESFLWLAAYARTTDDEIEAVAAMAALPRSGPPPFHPLTFAEPGIGRAYLFSGRVAEALPYLRRAAGGCHAAEFSFGLENGWEMVRAARDLGLAHERLGQHDEACAAYQRVLDRWGSARPRSVTAEDARTRRSALGCE